MRVLIWGLGYVGSVSAACLASTGHIVIGVDSDPTKVEAICSGNAPVLEPDLETWICQNVNERRLTATQNGMDLVKQTDLSIICVGTPSAPDGSTDTRAVERVAQTIGRGLREATNYHVVVVRSTVWPGTTGNLIRSILEAESGKIAGEDFGLAMNTEFLREGTAIADFYSPPYHIIGQLDARSGAITASLYSNVEATCYHVPLEEAEITKVVNNAFHALKIGFANEIGRLCTSLNMDGSAVMNLVCADTKLNISRNYLRPGNAFGGSCLPKDLRNLLHVAEKMDLSLPILEGILPSNDLVIRGVCRRVENLKAKRVAVLGISFKVGTDDLRESPALAIMAGLQDAGIEVRAYDPDISPSRISANNLLYLRHRLPNSEQILCETLDQASEGGEAVVVCKKHPEIQQFIATLQSRQGTEGAVTVIHAT